MSRHATTLKQQPDSAIVSAEIDDLLSLDDLFVVEEQWCLERVKVLRDLSLRKIAEADWPQSAHWNWARKAATLDRSSFGYSGDARLFGLHVGGIWQGVLFGLSDGYFSRLSTPGEPLVYIDFVETAPWNWDLPALNRLGRFRGVGVQLMEVAARWSLSLGYGGRIGLHSLPQAERFYTRCRMKNLGPDASYNDLCYFELTEVESETFLRSWS